jgi:histidinol dehydrogenase
MSIATTDRATIASGGAPAALRLRFRGAAAELSSADEISLFGRRAAAPDDSVRRATREIIERVRRDGDRALVAMAQELDGVALTALEVPREALVRALDDIDRDLLRAMRRSASNIERVHRALLPAATETAPEPGIVIGRRPDPLDRVGIYAPGGRAVYPSSVLMGAIPARIAGVREIVLCSPPSSNGRPASVLLAAAALTGVDRVFAIGGAGAIAAMASGTETVPRVDRVVGPGNAYVAEAKLQLTGLVGIDAPAGPSELLVIADHTSNPDIIARELIAQAEHDPLACVVAIAVGTGVADAIEQATARELATTPRRAIVECALAGQGGVLTVSSIDDAITLANRYAPEHLLLALPSTERSDAILQAVRNAGTVFVGETASNAFGDYMTGANHVLPTGGLARSYSGLSTLDFVRWTTYQRIDRAAASRLATDVSVFAGAEDLPGHAIAAATWADPASASAPLTPPNAKLWVRREIAALGKYAEARDDLAVNAHECIDLSDNTNLWGSSPAASAALRDSSSAMARYPAPYSVQLKRSLADYVGVDSSGIVTGCGSDDVLDATMRAFAAPGDMIAYSTPTFSMIPVFARVNGLTALEVSLRDAGDEYDIDAERLVASGARIIYVCSPNNPTATPVSRIALRHVLDNAPGIVILDEAYAEFAGTSNVDLVLGSERLLVTRTLSKAFGLAGLRVGYGVGAPALVEYVERARGPYKVTAPSERAALAALENSEQGLGWMMARAMLACESRDRFARELQTIGLRPLQSKANFVLVPHVNARAIGRELARRGVLVRVLSELPRTLAALAASDGSALRIGVGPWSVMARVLELLSGVLS